MSSRSLVSMFITLMLLCFAATLYAQDTPPLDAAVNAQVAAAFAQASTADKSNHPDQAAQIYWSIVDRFPDHPQAPRAAKQAAYVTDKLKDRDQSIAAFKRALEAYPKSGYAPDLKKCLALSYQGKGDKAAAIKELQELVAQYPKSSAACEGLINLGQVYITQVGKDNSDAVNWQHKEAADAAFKQVVDTFPSKRDMCAKAELYRAGIAFERALAGRMSWDAAIKQVQLVKDAYPDAPKAILARLELMQAEKARFDNDNTEALLHTSKIIQDYGDCKLEVGWAHYVAGHASEDTGNYAKALEHFQSIINGGYANSDNFTNRDVTLYSRMEAAECYKLLGQKTMALDVLRGVVRDYPDAPLAQLAKQRADELAGGEGK